MAQQFNKELLQKVDALSPDQLLAFKQICPTDLKHYMNVQRAWIEEDIYYLGCELNRKPTPTQIAERILTGKQSRRFRAYYAMSYPDKVSCPESMLLAST
jgi:hypothetical protein